MRILLYICKLKHEHVGLRPPFFLVLNTREHAPNPMAKALRKG